MIALLVVVTLISGSHAKGRASAEIVDSWVRIAETETEVIQSSTSYHWDAETHTLHME